MLAVYFALLAIGATIIGVSASLHLWSLWQLLLVNVAWFLFVEQGHRTLMSWQHRRRIIERLTK